MPMDSRARRSLWGVALLGGIGFTMSLFVSGLAFHDEAMTDVSKAAILAGSLISGLAGRRSRQRSGAGGETRTPVRLLRRGWPSSGKARRARHPRAASSRRAGRPSSGPTLESRASSSETRTSWWKAAWRGIVLAREFRVAPGGVVVAEVSARMVVIAGTSSET